jgi:probable rRNA maturation factor
LLTDDSELQRLNRDFRYQDKPTNVLSFPAHEINLFNYQDLSLDEDNALFLGDIAISYERILEESIEQQKFFKEHFTHILVHSILHLIGYDHIDEHDADKMEQLEINILSSIGFKNPYILRDLDDQYLIKLK